MNERRLSWNGAIAVVRRLLPNSDQWLHNAWDLTKLAQHLRPLPLTEPLEEDQLLHALGHWCGDLVLIPAWCFVRRQPPFVVSLSQLGAFAAGFRSRFGSPLLEGQLLALGADELLVYDLVGLALYTGRPPT